MHHVLSVGSDLSLLYTRSLVLEQAGASVTTAIPDHALSLLNNSPLDLLVLCHSTQDHDIPRLCRAARAHAFKILLLESPTRNSHVPADVDHRFPLEEGPALLIATVKHLLALSADTTPASRVVPFVLSKRSGSSHKLPALPNLAQPQPHALRISISGEAKS